MRYWMAVSAGLLFAGSCAVGQTPGPVASQPPAAVSPASGDAGKPLAADASTDVVLDALQARGQGLNDFLADVVLTETDNLMQDSVSRKGKFWYQNKGNGDARIRVTFTSKQIGSKPAKEDHREYVLDEGMVTERDYSQKFQVNRQVLKPGQKINLLKLGEGPFPVPVGQAKEDVYKQFDVKKIDAKEGDPAGTVHIQLSPKPGSQFEKKFKSIDVWVDAQTHFPRRIETLDRSEATTRTTDLSNIQVNTGLKDKDFVLEKVNEKEWTIHDEPY